MDAGYGCEIQPVRRLFPSALVTATQIWSMISVAGGLGIACGESPHPNPARSLSSAGASRRPVGSGYPLLLKEVTDITRLAFGLAAAGGFGVIDRAEPARAFADIHLDFGIPAAGRLVIDAFAGTVDVALDG